MRFPTTALIFAIVSLAALGLATAHASLDATDPLDGAVLDVAPSTVTLEFSENVEVGFSVFAVHRLAEQLDLSDEQVQQRIAGLAAPQVKGWLDSPTTGEGLVTLTSEPASGAASRVELRFAEELTAGHYVVVWRVLSADTHPVEGFFTFTVAP